MNDRNLSNLVLAYLSRPEIKIHRIPIALQCIGGSQLHFLKEMSIRFPLIEPEIDSFSEIDQWLSQAWNLCSDEARLELIPILQRSVLQQYGANLPNFKKALYSFCINPNSLQLDPDTCEGYLCFRLENCFPSSTDLPPLDQGVLRGAEKLKGLLTHLKLAVDYHLEGVHGIALQKILLGNLANYLHDEEQLSLMERSLRYRHVSIRLPKQGLYSSIVLLRLLKKYPNTSLYTACCEQLKGRVSYAHRYFNCGWEHHFKANEIQELKEIFKREDV